MSSYTERNPIRHRTETDWTANGIRSDGGRKPIGRRTETNRTADGNDRGCSCLSCTNQATTASSHRIHRTHRSLLLKCTPTEFTEFSCRGELLCILRVPWDNTTQPKHLWASVPSVGGLLSGWRGYGRDAIPS